jgi:hypothetical protein
MTPGKYNLICPQGSTLQTELIYSVECDPVNLFGYSARMQVREKHTSKKVILDLTTENLRISLGEEGQISLFISSEDTSFLHPKEYVYDLELISPSEYVSRIIEGKFIVTPEVTR